MKFTNVIKNKELEYVSYPIANNIVSSLKTAKKMALALWAVYPTEKLRLICAGSSGAILSALIAAELKDQVEEIIHIKKDGEKSHEDGHNAGTNHGEVNVIVDDLIATGATIGRITDKFIGFNPHQNIDAVIVNMEVNLSHCADYAQTTVIDKLICYGVR